MGELMQDVHPTLFERMMSSRIMLPHELKSLKVVQTTINYRTCCVRDVARCGKMRF
jgi:hypothetical protein